MNGTKFFTKKIRMRLRLLFAAAFLIIFSFALSDADQFENPRVQWMKGKYGIMVHWLYPYFGGDVDEIVGGFNIDTFMSDFESSGAEWLIFTAGQNTGAAVRTRRLKCIAENPILLKSAICFWR